MTCSKCHGKGGIWVLPRIKQRARANHYLGDWKRSKFISCKYCKFGYIKEKAYLDGNK